MSAALSGGTLAALFLILMRTTGFVVAAPIYGNRHVPPLVKAGLAGMLMFFLAPRVGTAPHSLPFLLAAPIELAIGLAYGYALSLCFLAFELIGRLLALQTGLSLGTVFNPTNGELATPFDPLFTVFSALLFLAASLHIAAIDLLGRSFGLFPLGQGPALPLVTLLTTLSVEAINMGLRIALPLALLLLTADLVVALLARVVPQINVFLLGLPLKLLIGFALILAALPAIASSANQFFTTVIRAASGGASS